MGISSRSASLALLALGLGACTSGSYDSYQEVAEVYNLNQNGCSTGKQEFKARSKEDAKKMMCDALQDDLRNKTCSRPMREEHFKKNCIGQVFKPRSGKAQLPTPTPVQVPPQHPTPAPPPPRVPTPMPTPVEPHDPGIDAATGERAKAALLNLTVAKVSVLTPHDDAVNKVAEQIASCGFSYMGPKCLDSVTVSLESSGTRIDGSVVYFSRMKIEKLPTQLGLLFKFERTEPSAKVMVKMQVVTVLKPRLARPLASYLKDPSSIQPVIDVELDESAVIGAWRRLASPRSIRELYHMSGVVNGSAPDALAKLQSILRANKSLIQQASETAYQEAMLTRLTTEIALDKDVLAEIVGPLMSSTNSNIQTAAAIAVLSSQPANTDAKAIVVRLGLANASWEIRKNSVVALSKSTLGTSEENALLGMLADSDKDVRAEAVLAASKMKVSEKHIAKVRELAGNSLWETRAQAVSLLARIGTEMAVGILIEKMEDGDTDVRNAVREALSKQALKESHVAALAVHLKSANWEVRRAALALIGTISGQAATNELIKALNDSDSDARAEAFQQLYGRKLGSDSVAPLSRQFESDSFEVRVSIAKLLGKIKSKASIEALKKQLAKETDEDVKTQIKASMKTAKP